MKLIDHSSFIYIIADMETNNHSSTPSITDKYIIYMCECVCFSMKFLVEFSRNIIKWGFGVDNNPVSVFMCP